MLDWVANVETTHYVVGSVVGPHPFPLIVRDFQSCIGNEARQQFLEKNQRLPDAVVACVGGGSNAMGLFHAFVPDKDIKLVGVEAGGEAGLQGTKHCATLSAGTPGVLHGMYTYLIQNEGGQILETHSISAGNLALLFFFCFVCVKRNKKRTKKKTKEARGNEENRRSRLAKTFVFFFFFFFLGGGREREREKERGRKRERVRKKGKGTELTN